ncbi:MAG: PDZ domain-containing protein [Campylobacterales bacterium]|nr:PDZ domain-containing protein [Campylobacterales bacterium]
MNQIFNKPTINFLITILTFILIAKILSVGMLYFLPKSGVEKSLAQSSDLPYNQYKVSQIFDLKVSQVSTQEIKQEDLLKIDNLILKALYSAGSNSFVVICETTSQNKSEFLKINDTYKGFKLLEIKEKDAIFDKDGKKYSLTFKEEKSSTKVAQSVSLPIDTQVSTNGAVRVVGKREIQKYRENFNSIWDNIAIKEIVNNGVIEGFKVLSIKSDSIFNQLGLKANDVIKAVNNKEIKNYSDAFKIYNNIDNMESLKLTIIRDNQVKELEYEVF